LSAQQQEVPIPKQIDNGLQTTIVDLSVSPQLMDNEDQYHILTMQGSDVHSFSIVEQNNQTSQVLFQIIECQK